MGRKISILTFGSKGDVQPLIALGSRLNEHGYDIQIIVSSNNVRFVESFGLKAIPCFPDFEAFLREDKRCREVMQSGKFLTYVDSQIKWADKHFPQAIKKQWTAVESWTGNHYLTTLSVRSWTNG